MKTKTSKEVIEKVERIVRKELKERFEDDSVFDPIFVEPRFDHDGCEFLRVFIIVDEDRKPLDTSRTFGLARAILGQVTEEEVPNVPRSAFIERSEWEEYLELREREPWIRMG